MDRGSACGISLFSGACNVDKKIAGWKKLRKNRRHKVHKICAGYIELVAKHKATLPLDDDKTLPIPSQSLTEDI